MDFERRHFSELSTKDEFLARLHVSLIAYLHVLIFLCVNFHLSYSVEGQSLGLVNIPTTFR
jgi:hypothetical protein